MSNKTQEGGCQCGAIRFRTTAKPVRAMACHCKTCKQRTGGAYGIGVYFKQEDIEFVQGEYHEFKFHSTESGRWLRNEFCPKCGASVAWTLELRPGIRGIAGGCYDDPDWFDIEAHIWADSARSDMQYPADMVVHGKTLPA
jgi:hypothetical protein